MSYIDVNGKRGFRMLAGASGKTYSNAKLLTPTERTAMLADGITEVAAAAPITDTRTLAQKKEDTKQAVNRDRARLLQSLTVDFGEPAVTYDADPASIANLNNVLTLISAGVTMPDPYTWRAADNSDQILTHQQLKDLGLAMSQAVQSLYSDSWAVKAAIDAAADDAALEAVTPLDQPVA